MQSPPFSAVLFAAVLTANFACPVTSNAQFGPRRPRLVSPEVLEGEVSFRVLAPVAESVKLTGSDIPGVGQGMDMTKRKDGLKLFWFATGKDDSLLETSRATVEMFKKHKFDVIYNETGGAHTWIVWREYLKGFSKKLFKSI